MRQLRNLYTNAAVTAVVSLFYATIFILTSGHLEFERILSHTQTLDHALWNAWSVFLQQGHLKYVGLGYIAAAVLIVAMSLVRRKNYDEYQTRILAVSFMVSGLILLLLFPVVLLLVLSDPHYAVETVLLLVVLHWSAFLIADLFYVVKWGRE